MEKVAPGWRKPEVPWRAGALPNLDGDKSPAESGDKSPHSMSGAVLRRPSKSGGGPPQSKTLARARPPHSFVRLALAFMVQD